MNMNHLKKYISIKFSDSTRYIIEQYICRKREIENTCKICFIFKEIKHFSINFKKEITHYTTLQILIYSHSSHVSTMDL